jgi:hypothetical protein
VTWQERRQSFTGAVIVGGGVALGIAVVSSLIVGVAVLSQQIAGWM